MKVNRKFYVSVENLLKRYLWGLNFIDWRNDDWEEIVFSDECKLFPQKLGTHWIRRKRGDKILRSFSQQREHYHGGLEVMVWGAISFNGVGRLARITERLNGPGYQRILDENLNFQGLFHGDLIFQQDNNPIHLSDPPWDWFQNNRICLLPWPSQSPDLNPIENLWGILEDRLWEMRYDVRDADDLWDEAQRIWYSDYIDNFIPRLYHSMENRVRDLITNFGMPVNY